MSRISLELEDLRRAVQQCEYLKQKLQLQEQQMRSLYRRLHDWKGASAVKLESKMEAFLREAAKKAYEIDIHKEQLQRYIQQMERVDLSYYGH
ncbi:MULTISPECIES: hypothetical protein [unclassified Paenibacillus]|uniref:hypothetical protein n=1 Tax=unclassified Paenibacillus TaxID=185978 RepID=UPI0008389317|nr:MULTISPECIES: hypothetical protein [unclassified Paenibacillus]NWL88370.1 hypothetical protein [Paenibacillus sp. 79R4]